MFKKRDIIIFILIEVILTGIGMGIPIFLIISGFFTGIFLTKKIIQTKRRNYLKTIFKYSILTSIPTFLFMITIWGAFTINILNKNYSIINSGIPMILYDPITSFIGWIILMIIISPFLQFLMTLFGAWITLINSPKTL